jgi:predicted ATPase
VDLRAFNLLIGANASGKSNFVSIFRFLPNALQSGLDSAVSMEGVAKLLRNLLADPSDPVSIGLSSDLGLKARYELTLNFQADRPIVTREFLKTELGPAWQE